MSLNTSMRLIYEALGFKGERLPKDERPHQVVKGIAYYVVQRLPGRLRHRLRAVCPSCSTHLSASRLWQHIGTKTCEWNRVKKKRGL